MSSPTSLRLPKVPAEKVRAMAALERRSFAEMVRVFAEEAIRVREFPGVVFTDGPTGRRATFRGGLDVCEVIEPYLLAGKDWSALRDSYRELDEAKLRVAVRYYESYADEIEARVALNQAP